MFRGNDLPGIGGLVFSLLAIGAVLGGMVSSLLWWLFG